MKDLYGLVMVLLERPTASQILTAFFQIPFLGTDVLPTLRAQTGKTATQEGHRL